VEPDAERQDICRLIRARAERASITSSPYRPRPAAVCEAARRAIPTKRTHTMNRRLEAPAH
jgi:hypothetical protein